MLQLDRRYQVFVSSTYRDLTEERAEVIQALLELDCIPAGMELFPASSQDQWELIRRVIDDCDYYVVIVGGRYGSVDNDGISYTEREYDYAAGTGMPVLGFVHGNPDDIKVAKTDKDAEAAVRLAEFRAKVEGRPCRYWENPTDLGGKVSRSLVQEMKRQPQVGWVRASSLPSMDVMEELALLQEENRDLKSQLAGSTTTPPERLDELAHGADLVEIKMEILYYSQMQASLTLGVTWDEIVGLVGPLMFDEASESVLRARLNKWMQEQAVELHNAWFKENKVQWTSMRIAQPGFDVIKTQLAAIKVIEKSIRKRGVKDSSTYWRLTPYGEALVFQLSAIPKGQVRPPWMLDSDETELSGDGDSTEVNSTG